MIPPSSEHVTVRGKFLQLGGERLYVKGFCYGPFAENSYGEYLPEQDQIACDLAHMRRLGANNGSDFTHQRESALHKATSSDHPDPLSKLSIPQPSA